MEFLSDLEWSWSAFFVNLLEPERSRSLVSNFKIETKNDASVNCDLDVTTTLVHAFPKFEKFGDGV